MSSEVIQTGKKYRILADAKNKIWHVISFFTKACDVEFNNGNNAQTTLGSITGITSSLTSTSSNVAASAAAVKELNDKITQLNSDLGGVSKLFSYVKKIVYGNGEGRGELFLHLKSDNKIKSLKMNKALALYFHIYCDGNDVFSGYPGDGHTYPFTINTTNVSEIKIYLGALNITSNDTWDDSVIEIQD